MNNKFDINLDNRCQFCYVCHKMYHVVIDNEAIIISKSKNFNQCSRLFAYHMNCELNPRMFKFLSGRYNTKLNNVMNLMLRLGEKLYLALFI